MPVSSTIATGTASPTSASHATAGKTKKLTRNGAGAKASAPTTTAVPNERADAGTLTTRADAAANDALRRIDPTVAVKTSWPIREVEAVS